ncbi:MAG: response regulator, partial [Chitinophagaceae bacterium]
MKKRILIVEDEFVEANNLEMILLRAGYQVCELADSVPKALKIIEKEQPDLVLLDIFLLNQQHLMSDVIQQLRKLSSFESNLYRELDKLTILQDYESLKKVEEIIKITFRLNDIA